MRSSVTFYLNGEKKEVSGEQLFLPLSSYLRYERQLTGTKVVCAEGDCGACTVMVARWSPDQKPSYISINSCIAMTFSLDACHVVTVEGLGDADNLSEVQCSMVRNFGGQCGFCTPGFVMSITNMYEQNQKPTEQNVKNYLTGNLCRCTGYLPIIKSALDVDLKKHTPIAKKFPFPDFGDLTKKSVKASSENVEYFAPTTLVEACTYKNENPDVVIFSGSTDLGVQFNKGHIRPKKIMSLHLIPELYHKSVSATHVEVGARVTLTDLQKLIEKEIPQFDQYLHIFASPQIKNNATLVGNLANASPIGDNTPVMLTLEAELEVYGLKGRKNLALKDFYLGYKKLNLQKDEIIASVKFKIPEKSAKFANYKVSQRRDLDISTVNASFKFEIENNAVKSARISLGGVAATTLRLIDIENKVLNKKLSKEFVEETKVLLMNEIKPLSDVRGKGDYRKILVGKLFEKFAQEHLGL
ncbi:MAG: xanthine dehydrogenase small subunit [Pseudobdellovibrio sp.]